MKLFLTLAMACLLGLLTFERLNAQSYITSVAFQRSEYLGKAIPSPIKFSITGKDISYLGIGTAAIWPVNASNAFPTSNQVKGTFFDAKGNVQSAVFPASKTKLSYAISYTLPEGLPRYTFVTYNWGDHINPPTWEYRNTILNQRSGSTPNSYDISLQLDRSTPHANAANSYTRMLTICFWVNNYIDKTIVMPITITGQGDVYKGTNPGPIELITILRAAPGDQSYVSLSTSRETSNEVSMSVKGSTSSEETSTISANVGFSAGPFDASVDVEGSVSSTVSKTQGKENSYTFTYTTTKEYKNTSKSDMFITEQHGLDWGLSLDIGARVVDGKFVQVYPKAPTKMVFYRRRAVIKSLQPTELELINTIIPELERKKKVSEANFWKNLIKFNNDIKKFAPKRENIVLTNNGPVIGFATKQATSQAFTQEVTLENSVSLKVTVGGGVEIGPIEAGAEVSTEKKWTVSTTTSNGNTNTTEASKTISYQIADDEFGAGSNEKIVYDLYEDRVYGTPIFWVNSLQSSTSCPWEKSTTPRDQLSLTVQDPTTVTPKELKTAKYSDIPVDQEVSFDLNLKNNNKTEKRKYNLSIPLPNDGLIPGITLNGAPYGLNQVIPFTINQNTTQKITLSFKNNDSKKIARAYQDIKVMLESDCDEDIVDSVLVSAFFGTTDKNRTPDNDLACNAILLPIDGSLQKTFTNALGKITISNKNATAPLAEQILKPVTDCNTGWCSETADNQAEITNSVWFKVITKSPQLTIEMCDAMNNAFDSQIAVYRTTDCEDLSTFKLVGANDNGCGSGQKSSKLFLDGLQVGVEYYIMVDGFQGAQSDFGIQVSSPAPPNDNACSLEFLTVNGLPNQGVQGLGKSNFHYFNNLATVEKNEHLLTPTSTDPIIGWKKDSLQHSVWFAFEAPEGGEMQVDILNATFDAQVSVFGTNGNICGSDYFSTYGKLGSNDDISLDGGLDCRLTLTGLTPLKRYLIVVDGYKGETGTFDIVLSATPPVNDEPCNAIALETNGFKNGTFRNIGATTTLKEQNLLTIPYNEDGIKGWTDKPDNVVLGKPVRVIEKSVWFKFKAPASGSVIISTCNMADFQLQLALFQVGKCNDFGTFKYLMAEDNSSLCPAPASPDYPNGRNVRGSIMTIDKLQADSTYYIVVDGGIMDAGSFSISITTSPSSPPANDNVCNAIKLPTTGVVQKGFTNLGATVVAAENAIAPNRWNDQNMNSTVWFTFVAPPSGEVEIATCNLATFDTQLAVYASPTCTSFTTFTLVAANDDGPKYCSTNGGSLLPITGLTPGQTYYLVVDGYATFTGNFDIVIKDKVTPGPVNDDVTKAILLPVNNVVQKGYTNVLATATKLEQTIKSKNTGDCINGWCDDQVDNSVWFTFVAPADGVVNVSACDLADFDTQLAVFSATDVTNFSTFTLIGANDAGPEDCSTFFDSYLPIKGLKAGQTYYVMVDGYNGDMGNFDIVFSGVADTQAPSSPTNLIASDIQVTSAKVTWTAATDNVGVKEYRVYVDGVLKTTVTAVSVSLSGLVVSTTYSIRVTAVDAAGNVSAASATLKVTTSAAADTQAPSGPTNLVATDTKSTSITVSWSASTDNVGVKEYRVYVDGALKSTTPDLSFTLTGLTASTAYSIYVVAADAAGNVSAASTSLKVTTLATPDTQAPSAPTNLAASDVQTTSVKITWTAATDNVGVKEYRVYVDGALKTTTTDVSVTLSALTASTAYSIYVVAVDVAGNVSAASSSLKVTTNGVILAIEESPISNQYEVFPNPFRDRISLKFPKTVSFPERIELIDMQGKILTIPQLRDEVNRTIQMDLNAYSAGVFFLMIESKAGMIYKKIIKQ